MDTVLSLQPTADDFKALSTFRVDLVGHNARTEGVEMLEYLLANGMPSSSTNLVNAVRFGETAAVELLLKFGRPPESADSGETTLMTAASLGHLDIVKLLVAAGADIDRSADDKGEWTPSQYAISGGHKEVAEWLTAQMSEGAVARKAEVSEGRNPKFQVLYDKGTAAEGATTDDIVAVLERWDEQYGLDVGEVTHDSVQLQFERFPMGSKEFVREAVTLCPELEEDMAALSGSENEKGSLLLWWD